MCGPENARYRGTYLKEETTSSVVLEFFFIVGRESMRDCGQSEKNNVLELFRMMLSDFEKRQEEIV